MKQQPKHPLTEEWIKKMWHIYTHTHTHTRMEYSLAIRRNKTGSFVVMWMDPQSVTQSEVRKKKKLYINTLTESRKLALLNLFSGHESRLRRMERICGCRAGRKGGVNWEIRIDIYTAMCETD